LAFPLILIASGSSDFDRQKLAFQQQKCKNEQAAKAEAALNEEQDKADQGVKWRIAAVQPRWITKTISSCVAN
jgi:hypothetical protein